MSCDGPDTVPDAVRVKVIKAWLLCSPASLFLILQTLTVALFSRPKSQTRR